ncbi:endospore germination permease [Desulforamulus ruminis]|uniref:GerAB/ArcD/ProY family transporter n=1 Tax=Desulforamulus ruminis TaxID=1564 RepID=UPI002FD9E7E6
METWKISEWQAMGYLVMIVFATSILFVPGLVAKEASTASWLALIIALAVGMLIALISTSLGLRYPGKTLIQYAVDILGFPLGKLVSLLFIFYFFYVSYFVLRQFQALMSAAYMPETPPVVFMVLLTLLSCSALYLGLEVIVRANSLILFFNLLAFLIIFFVFIGTVDWFNLKPDFSKGVGPIINGSLSPSSWFGETAAILMLIPFIQRKSAVRRITLYALLLLFFLLEIVIITVVGNFGPERTSRLVFPLFTLLSQPPHFVQELFFQPSALFMAVWISGMLMKLTTFFFAGVYGLAQWFGLASYRCLVLPGGALIVVLAFISWPNTERLLDFSRYTFPLFVLSINLGLPLLLYVFSLFRHGLNRTKGAA